MPTVKQIAAIIADEIVQSNADKSKPSEAIDRAAEKIVALFGEDTGILTAAAMLENEVTSTLMDMTVATVLATLIEEEGGGRSNISISPMSMDHMNQHYLYEVSNDGLIRTVRIKLREDSDLQNEAAWREPSNRHGLVDVAPPGPSGTFPLKPQAEPKEHNRPVWVIRNGHGSLFKMANREVADEAMRHGSPPHGGGPFADDPLATIENRWCMHVECPSTGCNLDPELRDKPEATSD
jgi:hypothetical protein